MRLNTVYAYGSLLVLTEDADEDAVIGQDGRLHVGGRSCAPNPVVVTRDLKSCLRRVAAAEVFDEQSEPSDVESDCSDDMISVSEDGSLDESENELE